MQEPDKIFYKDDIITVSKATIVGSGIAISTKSVFRAEWRPNHDLENEKKKYLWDSVLGIGGFCSLFFIGLTYWHPPESWLTWLLGLAIAGPIGIWLYRERVITTNLRQDIYKTWRFEVIVVTAQGSVPVAGYETVSEAEKVCQAIATAISEN